MKNILLYSFLNVVGPGHRVSFPPEWNTHIGRIPMYIFITWDKGTCHPSYYIIIIIATVTAEHGRISIPIKVHIIYILYTSTAGPRDCDFSNQSETVHERHCTRTCTHSCVLSNGYLIDSNIRRTHIGILIYYVYTCWKQ